MREETYGDNALCCISRIVHCVLLLLLLYRYHSDTTTLLLHHTQVARVRAKSSRQAPRLPLGVNDYSVGVMKLFSNQQQPTGARELVPAGWIRPKITGAVNQGCVLHPSGS